MFDELQRLGDNPGLVHLLAHYAQLGVPNPECWHDRVMQFQEAQPKEMVKLHGELLAHGWIEPNFEPDTRPVAGIVPHCYRATSPGIRALRRVLSDRESEPRS